MKKLKASNGESIVELLVSILIAGMSGLLMAVMISTAASLNLQAQETDAEFYGEVSAADAGVKKTDMLEQKLTIADGAQLATIPIDVYGKEGEHTMFAFGRK